MHPVSRNRHIRDEPGDISVQGLLNRILCVNVGEIHRDVPVLLMVEGEGASHAGILGNLLGRRVVLNYVPKAHDLVDLEVAKSFDLKK